MLCFFCVEGLIELLERRRSQDSAYIGCMKSGEVVTEEYVIYHILFQPNCGCLPSLTCVTLCRHFNVVLLLIDGLNL